MKTLSFAGFKIKVITSRLLPKTTIYAFASPHHAKTFAAILASIDNLLKTDKLRFIMRKPKGKIIRPS